MKLSDISGIHPDVRSFKESKILPTNDFVGVEIELEGFKHRVFNDYLNSKFWNVKNDPSLRDNGVEFNFKLPLCGKDVEIALKHFKDFIDLYEDRYNKISCSERSSVHVHIDVREFSVQETLNFCLIYSSFERLLFKIFGKNREESNYCIPIYKSTDKVNLSKVINSHNGRIVSQYLQTSKYSSFNTSSIFNFGSIEFRMHYGTTDIDQILNWISVLLYMKDYARNFKWDVENYPAKVSEIGVDNFIAEVFKDRSGQFFYNGFHEDLINGVRTAQDMIIRLSLEREHNNSFELDIVNPKLIEKFKVKPNKQKDAGDFDLKLTIFKAAGITEFDIMRAAHAGFMGTDI